MKGRHAMLKAVFGGSSDKDSPKNVVSAKDAAGVRSLLTGLARRTPS